MAPATESLAGTAIDLFYMPVSPDSVCGTVYPPYTGREDCPLSMSQTTGRAARAPLVVHVDLFGLQPVQMGLDTQLQVGGCGVQAGFLLGTHGDHLPPSHHERTQDPEVGVGPGAAGDPRLQ